MKVVFPEPDTPTRKTNSPLSMSTVTFRSSDGRTLVGLGDVLESDHKGDKENGPRPTGGALQHPTESGLRFWVTASGAGHAPSPATWRLREFDDSAIPFISVARRIGTPDSTRRPLAPLVNVCST